MYISNIRQKPGDKSNRNSSRNNSQKKISDTSVTLNKNQKLLSKNKHAHSKSTQGQRILRSKFKPKTNSEFSSTNLVVDT